ncbi:uncharacterized protein LOC132737348 [Ruditapes philippinarum]|uniref:uncharacterized protein LOC132737348 n=1 Tax=Ruditapes philippinarum TaxID=129788 RepID=UPI00295AA6F8|nr:uncharacterized protein LOC132737348 [Ruditapes philippinarum]XP_060580601.1 uncharacterized protein LOC132737348 [Ruditapes philippinarum]
MATNVILAIVLTVFVSATKAGTGYIGCFQDNSTRILEGTMTSGSMTVEKCVQRCSMEREMFAGVEYSNQCFCGSQLRPYAKSPESECSYNCGGNSGQKCGGFWRISLYNTHRYLGCYVDSNSRILSEKNTSDNKMTTELCLAFCKGHGLKYALTQYSSQCFCGNSLGNVQKAPDSECSYDCKGATSEKCGGFWRGSLYLVV